MAPKRFVYSEEEKDVLTSLVHKYSHILENKKTDAVSLNLKTQLWETLSTEYNSINGIRPRDVKQLKKLWDNLKVKWKSAKAEETRTTFGTGGGPPPEKMPRYLELVGATASHMSTRVANRHDSDGRYTVPGPTAAVVEILAPMQEDDDSRYCCNFDASPDGAMEDSDEVGAEVPEAVQDAAAVALPSTEASAATTSTALPATVLPPLPSAASLHTAARSAAVCAATACAATLRTAAPSVTMSRPASGPRKANKRTALVSETLSAERDARVQAVREESALRMQFMAERQAWQKEHEEQQHALHMEFLNQKYAIELEILREQRDGGKRINAKET